MTAGPKIPDAPARRALRVAVGVCWAIGWLMAERAAYANLYIEPTDQAVATAAHAVPLGYAGAGVMLVAALARRAYRPWRQVLWFAAFPLLTLMLFAREPGSRGAPLLWLLLSLLAAVGVLTWGHTRARSHRS